MASTGPAPLAALRLQEVRLHAQGWEGAALIREGRQGKWSKAFEQPTGSVKLRRVEVTPSVLRPLYPCILCGVGTER